MFPDVSGRRENACSMALVSSGAAFQVRNMVKDSPEIIGQTLPVWVRRTTTSTC
jgi:phosphate transport system permease protein